MKFIPEKELEALKKLNQSIREAFQKKVSS
jgi:hypothetical protein